MAVTVAGLDDQPVSGKKGYGPLEVDRAVDGLRADDFDALVIPGGFAPDKLRRSSTVLDLVRAFDSAGKPIAFICHAGWVPISAKILSGRKATSVGAIRDDMENAGVAWVDEADGRRRQPDLRAHARRPRAVARRRCSRHCSRPDRHGCASPSTPPRCSVSRPAIGRYVAGLVDGLTRLPDAARADPERLHLARSEGRARPRPVSGSPAAASPARLLQQVWGAVDFPPVEWLTGDADVVHGTDFVLPPAGAPSASSPCTTSPTCTTSPRSRRRPSRYQRLVRRAMERGAVTVTPSQADEGRPRRDLRRRFRSHPRDPARHSTTPGSRPCRPPPSSSPHSGYPRGTCWLSATSSPVRTCPTSSRRTAVSRGAPVDPAPGPGRAARLGRTAAGRPGGRVRRLRARRRAAAPRRRSVRPGLPGPAARAPASAARGPGLRRPGGRGATSP